MLYSICATYLTLSSEVFDIFMRAKHRKYFEMLKKAILFDVDSKSASQTVSTVLDSSDLDLNKLICFRCISARRDTENKEGDNTLSSLSNRYYEKTKDDESNPTVANFEDTLHSTDKALSGVYDGLFEKVIKKVKKFGGIRENETVVKIISTLSQQGLCIIDDKLQEFIDNNEYLYWRVSDIAFVEVQNLYKYIEGYMPFSTQHKIKGLEFKNVLIVLHNGGWNNYNFEYLFNRNVGAMLTPAQKRSYPNILRRTQKLFYVCCTRAKDNLVVYYPSPSDEVLEGAVSLFGRDNCIDLDAE